MAEYDRNVTDSGWERSVLEKVALAAVAEQRASRRWGILFKSLILLYLFFLLFVGVGWIKHGDYMATSGRHTALVELSGVISEDSQASADNVTTGLDAAFKDTNTAGVILRINSPGGSPVQAGRINDEIKRLRALNPNIPLYAVIEDIGASGAYYAAVAADKIYVDKASIVGSIGVIMDGFGFTGIMDKAGVERRAIAAGDNKTFLDPFLPVNPQQKEYAQKMLEQVHQQFINVVRSGRGSRLKETPDLYSGLVWVGEKSIEIGLADGIGSIDSVARDVIKAENIVDYTPHENIAERVARKFGAALGEVVLKAVSYSGGLR
jgi:protease-4